MFAPNMSVGVNLVFKLLETASRVLANGQPRQLNAVIEDEEKAALIASREVGRHWLRIDHGRGAVYRTTLFNKLVGGRPALVHDTPGLTRDRRYGETDYFGRTLRVVDTGQICPVIDRVFPLAEARHAHQHMDQQEQFGKIVLKIGE